MKYAVADANYRDASFDGLGLSWLRWEAERAGVSFGSVAEADVVLCSFSSQQGASSVRTIRKRMRREARLIAGGAGGYAPVVIEKTADAVCAGEGAAFMRSLWREGIEAAMARPEVWIAGESHEVVPNSDYPWEMPPLRHPDGTIRIAISRGCRSKCLFCQTGWENHYRVRPDIEAVFARARGQWKGERIAFLTNDGADQDIPAWAKQEFISVKLANLRRMMPLSRGNVKSVRIGVEGVSARLRTAVHKPIEEEELMDVSARLLQAGIGVRWFFIAGLPGERDDDYEELKAVVMRLHALRKGVVMMNFHAFIPQPAAPLAVLPLQDGYWERFDRFRTWFFDGLGFTRRVQIMPPAREPGRLTRAMESMAATEDQLRRGWWTDDNRNWRLRYLTSKGLRRGLAAQYAREVGLSVPMRADGAKWSEVR